MSLRSAHKYILIAIFFASSSIVYAFTTTGVAPAFFGPNALPVPEMSDGQTSDQLRLEIAADGYLGYDNSQTADIFARLSAPLFTRWANLSIWMPVYEWYKQADGKGSGAGDVYVSTDVQILHNSWFKHNTQYIPQMTVRVGVKTASGEQFNRYRHYDSPGYFFDLTMGQYIPLQNLELRLAGSVGFLCWQTANARQNDAVMYGLQLLLRSKYISLRTIWSGYIGWENAGDRPMTIKGRLSGHVKNFDPYVEYQYGIKDYPFHNLRIGIVYNIDILKKKSKIQ